MTLSFILLAINIKFGKQYTFFMPKYPVKLLTHLLITYLNLIYMNRIHLNYCLVILGLYIL